MSTEVGFVDGGSGHDKRPRTRWIKLNGVQHAASFGGGALDRGGI